MLKTTRALLRIILGALTLVFGLNKFFHFIPFEIPAGTAQEYWSALDESSFFFPILGGLEILLGLLLISGYWVRAVLFVLLPISISALLFYLFLYPDKIGGAAAIFTLNVYLLIVMELKRKLGH